MKHLIILSGLLFQTVTQTCVPQYSVVNVQNSINAALGCTAYANSETDVFLNSGPPFNLNHIPLNSPAPNVYVNGLLQLLASDYTITNLTVTFSNDLGTSPTIQVVYWYAP